MKNFEHKVLDKNSAYKDRHDQMAILWGILGAEWGGRHEGGDWGFYRSPSNCQKMQMSYMRDSGEGGMEMIPVHFAPLGIYWLDATLLFGVSVWCYRNPCCADDHWPLPTQSGVGGVYPPAVTSPHHKLLWSSRSDQQTPPGFMSVELRDYHCFPRLLNHQICLRYTNEYKESIKPLLNNAPVEENSKIEQESAHCKRQIVNYIINPKRSI